MKKPIKVIFVPLKCFQLHELKSQLQSVRLAMGGALMKEGKLFEAMEMFEQVKTPPGMYNLAQVLSVNIRVLIYTFVQLPHWIS